LQLPQNQTDLLSYLNALAASRGLTAAQTSLPAQYNTTQVTPSLSELSITLARIAPKSAPGIRVSGTLGIPGNRTIFASGIPGIVYSDGTFEVYGLPPGRHSIVTTDHRLGARPMAAAVVVANSNLDGILLAEAAVLPNNAWEPAPSRHAGDHPPGNVPLARITGTLVEAGSRKPIAEGSILIKTSGSTTASFPVDTEGRFELPPLLPGTYNLDVQVFGRSSAKQTIEIDDKDIKLELTTLKLY
jgi:hypothetical protein